MAKSDALYEADFFCWTVENAALLRARKFDQLDLEHIAEEIEDMGRRDRREVRSRLTNLIAHLLKWQFQAERRSRSWSRTIARERSEIPLIFEDSPSLRQYAGEGLGRIYKGALQRASLETSLPAVRFPETCPYTLEQVLDGGYLPE